MTEFHNPGDIFPAIRDMLDPIQPLMRDIPRKELATVYISVDTSTVTPDSVSSSEDVGGNVDHPVESPEQAALRESLGQLYKEEMKVFASRKNTLNQNIIKLWGIVWGQCSPALQAKIKGDDDYATKFVKL